MRSLRKRFGKKLFDLRHHANLTQEQLAQNAEISVDFLSLMERGVNAPSFETLEKLSLAMGLPVKEFFNFDSDLS